MDNIIIHNKCGLPVELCECEDAEVKYNWKKDVFEMKNKILEKEMGKFESSKEWHLYKDYEKREMAFEAGFRYGFKRCLENMIPLCLECDNWHYACNLEQQNTDECIANGMSNFKKFQGNCTDCVRETNKCEHIEKTECGHWQPME